MNEPLGAPPLLAPAALRRRRCARHENREAVARCTGCGSFFCRECVSDHGGRLLCARCIEKDTTAKTRQPAGSAWRAYTGSALAFVILWISFYLTGRLLVRIPTEFHEGTIWKKMVESEED